MISLRIYISLLSITVLAHGITLQRGLHRDGMEQLRIAVKSSSKQYLDVSLLKKVIFTIENEKEDYVHGMIKVVHQLSEVQSNLNVEKSAVEENNGLISRFNGLQMKWHAANQRLTHVKRILDNLCGGKTTVKRHKRQHWSRGSCGLQPGR